jgi:segregation and condensation protein B
MTEPAGERAEQLAFTEIPEDRIVPTVGALLFSSAEPVSVHSLSRATGHPPGAIRAALSELPARLDGLGLILQRHAGDAYELATAPEHAPAVERVFGLDRASRLSRAALEVVAIIAYRQPVTRADIEAIRGVDSSGVLQTLLARELIEPIGRLPGPGNPIQYGTTPQFLRTFGLSGIDELPELPEDLQPQIEEEPGRFL